MIIRGNGPADSLDLTVKKSLSIDCNLLKRLSFNNLDLNDWFDCQSVGY